MCESYSKMFELTFLILCVIFWLTGITLFVMKEYGLSAILLSMPAGYGTGIILATLYNNFKE